MPKLIAALIRHGDYEQPTGVPSAHLPHPLTAKGRGQAQALGQSLAARERAGEFRIAARIDTSTLQRAWETGRIIARTLQAELGRSFEILSFDALCERSLGAMANLTVDEIARIIAADPRYEPLPEGWKSQPTRKLPVIGAESLLEAGARIATHIDARLRPLSGLAEEAEEDTLKLFVSHGAALRLAAVSLGTLALDEVPKLSMHHCRPVHIERRPDGSFAHHSGAWKIRAPAQAPRD